MSNALETKNILEEAKKMEQVAEVNAEKILTELEANGFSDQIEYIKNDEIKHQKIVDELINLLGL